jgi:hypothetical protein
MSSSGARSTVARTSLLVLVCLAAGCAQMSETACRGADWYQVGYRDGEIYGLRPQIDQYAYQCRAHGVEAQEPTYMAGWIDGHREWTRRVMGSECCGTR